MKKRLVATVLAWLLGSSIGVAQGPVPVVIASAGLTPGASILERPAPMVSFSTDSGRGNASRGWVGVEYLHWWISGAPVGVPLVTTGNPASPTAGVIGDPSTRVLFGNSRLDYGGLNGGRISMGYWFDCDSRLGVEASGFLLGRKSTSFSVASDAAGNPLLALPFQAPAGVEVRQLISNPLPLAAPQTGSVVITSTSRLWGADVNGVLNVSRGCNLSVDLLAGLRYFDLLESLQLDVNTRINLVRENGTFLINANVFDRFSTRNQFYGGQVGSRASYHAGRFSVNALGLIALGTTEHKLYTEGATNGTINGTAVPSPAGGFFTKPSNLGNFHTRSFSVVPQAQIKLGYDLTSNLRATVGYDAMYWSNVNRPGNQIDRVLGPQPGDRPSALNNHSGLWAQGVSAGLEFRW